MDLLSRSMGRLSWQIGKTATSPCHLRENAALKRRMHTWQVRVRCTSADTIRPDCVQCAMRSSGMLASASSQFTGKQRWCCYSNMTPA